MRQQERRDANMNQEDFHALSAKDIKDLFREEVPFEYVRWAQEDNRKAVQQLAASYMRKQERLLKDKLHSDEMYLYEKSFYEEEKFLVAGVDEVGRGPIAGPVTVAAVILPQMLYIPGLNDSKKLSPKKRDKLYDIIMQEAVSVSVVSLSPEVIDKLNIYEATKQAMYEALLTLDVSPEAVLVDAMPLKELPVPVESIVKGDSKSASIAAASVVAKVTRDRYMESMEDVYPGFGFAEHKGYYTALHKEAIEDLGITPIHRKSFEPIRTIVGWDGLDEVD